MDKIEAVKAWLLSRVGNPYIMGGTGQFCTVAYRKARAAQYPGSAANITKYCQRMNGTETSCQGCQWWDESTKNGKRAYDCAQLTRWAMDSVGIPLVSGSNSQWNKTAFAEKGDIAKMPLDKLCLVFRKDEDGKMGHVGFSMGDGTVIHARGHAYGVRRDKIQDLRWTHYGIPEGLYNDLGAMPGEEAEKVLEDVLAVYQVTGGRLALRKEPRAADDTFIRWIPAGARVEGLRDPAKGWVYVRYNGQMGHVMEKYLLDVEMVPDSGEEKPQEAPAVETVQIPRATAEALQEALEKALERG